MEDRYQILQAENGRVALDLLSQNKVDLIISDLMMPVMDGFQLLEKVKSKDRWRHLPVIMLTARKDVKVKLRALRIGVDDYITKPFEEEVLLTGIENLLRNYQMRQSLNTSENTLNDAPKISKEDLIYLQNLEDLVSESISDYRLNADFLAAKLAVSRSVFFKKVKELTGLTANDYINEVRYTKARELMENRLVSSVKAVAGQVGMKDVKYFSKKFKNRFGKSPSAYF